MPNYARRSTKKSSKTNYTKRKVVAKAIRKETKRIFAKNVLKVVKRNAETKFAPPQEENGLSIVAQNGATNVMTLINAQDLFDSVQQGTGQGDRVGNQISITNVSYKGSIVNISNSTRPFFVKMFVFKDKLNQVTSSAGDLQDIFQAGNQEQGPTNNPTDMISRFNKDRYIILATRYFKLGSSTSTTNPNNDFSVQSFFKINLTKHFKKAMYDDEGHVTKPSNLWIGFLISYADNTAITFSPYNGPTCEVSYMGELSFKDD